jgi:predicted transcriptional regulator of viral defense system
MSGDTESRAIEIFEKNAGMLKTSQAISLGIHPETFYKLRDNGAITNLSRGLYCLSDSEILYNPDLIAASCRVPVGVVCLISALAFHEITTQIPGRISMAIPRETRRPVIDYPQVEFFFFGKSSFEQGVEVHQIAGFPVKIYSPEKSVADCFKFRNKIGLDVAIEALRLCCERRRSKPSDLLESARACRVEKVMTPYLEALY